MTTSSPLYESLERAAEQGGDLYPQVYARFFAACPSAEPLMWHMDPLMRARMMDEVINLLLLEDTEGEITLVEFEAHSHQGSGVSAEMFKVLFEAIRDTLRVCLGADWTGGYEAAWQARIDQLACAFNGQYPEPKVA